MEKPYVRHLLDKRCFYRRQNDDNSVTNIEPKEGYIYSVVETLNKTWFYERWNKLNLSEFSVNSPYVKHTLKEKCFYRINGDDNSMTLVKPEVGYYKRKEEDFENEDWFNERWDKLTYSEFSVGSPYVKHTLKKKYFYRISGNDNSITLLKPKEGYYKKKEEDLGNEDWFNEKLSYIEKKRN